MKKAEACSRVISVRKGHESSLSQKVDENSEIKTKQLRENMEAMGNEKMVKLRTVSRVCFEDGPGLSSFVHCHVLYLERGEAG